MNQLSKLIQLDELKEIRLFGKKGFIHKRHRFILPLILYAQREGYIPAPCNIIFFDQHDDCRPPNNLNEVKQIDINKIELNEFIDFCKSRLSINNDDWVISGISRSRSGTCRIRPERWPGERIKRSHHEKDVLGVLPRPARPGL